MRTLSQYVSASELKYANFNIAEAVVRRAEANALRLVAVTWGRESSGPLVLHFTDEGK